MKYIFFSRNHLPLTNLNSKNDMEAVVSPFNGPVSVRCRCGVFLSNIWAWEMTKIL